MTALPTPVDLPGIWQRELLETGDGHRDETTLVLWFQARSLYCDIRLPSEGTAAQTDTFAGRITLSSEADHLRCTWHRHLDWTASKGGESAADIGLLKWTGEGSARRLREDGAEAPYFEIWQKRAEASPGDGAAELRDNQGREAFVTWVGDEALLIRETAAGLDAVLAERSAAGTWREGRGTAGRTPGLALTDAMPATADVFHAAETAQDGAPVLTSWAVTARDVF